MTSKIVFISKDLIFYSHVSSFAYNSKITIGTFNLEIFSIEHSVVNISHQTVIKSVACPSGHYKRVWCGSNKVSVVQTTNRSISFTLTIGAINDEIVCPIPSLYVCMYVTNRCKQHKQTYVALSYWLDKADFNLNFF